MNKAIDNKVYEEVGGAKAEHANEMVRRVFAFERRGKGYKL